MNAPATPSSGEAPEASAAPKSAAARAAPKSAAARAAGRLSNWLGRGGDMAPPADIESAALRSDRFRLEREADWRRLEAIVTQMEKSGLRRVRDDDLLALPTL